MTPPNPTTNARHVPGLWHCPTCGFTLVRRVLHAPTGAIGLPNPKSDVSEPCPNDGTALQPVLETVH